MDNKLIFCTAEQKNTDHTLVIDRNEEILARCVDCQSFIKFPNVKGKELDELITLNEEANKGQVIVNEPVEVIEQSEPEIEE